MTQHFAYPSRAMLREWLAQTPSASQDVVVLITGALEDRELTLAGLREYLDGCIRVLRDGGLLFVQGRPEYLPELGVYLDQHLRFKYWIAVESQMLGGGSGLPTVHAGLLLFTKGDARFNVRRVRFPHRHCTFCGKDLKDWGGKSHLMNPAGYVISDVWRDLPPADNYCHLSQPVLDTILQMPDFASTRTVLGIVAPREGVEQVSAVRDLAVQYALPGMTRDVVSQPMATCTSSDLPVNVILQGDVLAVLKQFPDNSVDLAFADPPYNLDKAYNVYEDEQTEASYVAWCNAWLAEYARVLKPTGSLYVLNLPRWTMYHAAFLNQHLYFQNWIVWDALSEPRGKLMPAHYGLLLYTKQPNNFKFNYQAVGKIDARHYCRRASCVRQRKAAGDDSKEPLTDIWWDVHRIKHRRDRDVHPCQLPEALLERIIRLSTDPGDIVLDAMAGTGTTLTVAARLNRRFIGIDLDPAYVRIARDKVAAVEQGYVIRQAQRRVRTLPYTKKELQLELRSLARQLGRLPTPEDVARLSQYSLEVFQAVFPTWGKALKAAKLDVETL
jgi:DNA modification methylase